MENEKHNDMQDLKKGIFSMVILLAMSIIPVLILGFVEKVSLDFVREDVSLTLAILKIRGSIESSDEPMQLVTELMQQIRYVPVRAIGFIAAIPIPWWLINSLIGATLVIFLMRLASVNEMNSKLCSLGTELRPFFLSLASASLAISLFYTNLTLRDREALVLILIGRPVNRDALFSSLFYYSTDKFFQLLMLTSFVIIISLVSIGAGLGISAKSSSNPLDYVKSMLAIANLSVATTLVIVFVIFNLPFVTLRT